MPPWLSSPDGSDVVRLGDEEAALDLVVDTALLGRIREEFSFRADAHPALVDNDEGKVEGEAGSGAEGVGVVGGTAANDKRGNALLEGGEGKEAGGDADGAAGGGAVATSGAAGAAIAVPRKGLPAPPFDPHSRAVIGAIQARMVEVGVCVLLPGLTPSEFSMLECKYGFEFPPDLRAFLTSGVPVGLPDGARSGWHDWRARLNADEGKGSETDTVGKQIEWNATYDTSEGGNGDPAEWGFDRNLIEGMTSTNHPLIPVYSHRMIPTIPARPGLPVLSMHDNDVRV